MNGYEYIPLPPPGTPINVIPVEVSTVTRSVVESYIALAPTNNGFKNIASLYVGSSNPIEELHTIQVGNDTVRFDGNDSMADPVGVQAGNNQQDIKGIQPNVTYAGNTAIYESAADAFVLATHWADYPATSTIRGNYANISSIFAKNGSICTIQNSTIITTTIDIDGQLLNADADQLFLNGIPIATLNNLSSIQDWSLYEAINTVQMANHDIINVKDIECSEVIAIGDLTTATQVNCAHINIYETGTQLGDVPATTTEIFEGVITNGSDIFNQGDIFTSTLYASTITTSKITTGYLNINTVPFGNNLQVVTNAAGTRMFAYSSTMEASTIAYLTDVIDWSANPASQNVNMANHSLSNVGSFTMNASLSNNFTLGGALLTPISQNNQYALNTRIVNTSPVTPMEITSAGGMNITANATLGTQEFNITFVGANGNDLNITAPDINLTMTDPGSFMNLTAPGGIALLGGGGFFMASGVFEVITGLDCSLITLGNIRIGSGNALGATTQIEKWEFNDGDVSAMNGTQYLTMAKTRSITNDITSDGGDGIQIFQSVSLQSNSVANFTTRTKLTKFIIDANSRVINMGNYGCNVSDSFILNLNNLSNTLSLSYLNGNTLTFTSSGGNVQLNGIGTISASALLSAPTVNASVLNVSTFNVSSITANTITANKGIFNNLYLSSTNVHLGIDAGLNQGIYAIAIGDAAGQTNQSTNAIAIGSDAGNGSQNAYAVAIGDNAGFASQGSYATALGANAGYLSQQPYSVAIGAGAGNTNLGSNSVAIGTSASANGSNYSNTLVLNATGLTLNPITSTSCYMAPIRLTADNSGYQTSMLRWNATSKEVSYAPLVGSIQIVATSATAINLLPTLYGKTYVLTGTTTQAFTTTSLTANDVGWFCVVHNGNGQGGGDINMTGMTGTTIIHNRTATANGGVLYLYWTGAALVGY